MVHAENQHNNRTFYVIALTMNHIATIVLKVINLIKSTMENVDSHVIMVIA